MLHARSVLHAGLRATRIACFASCAMVSGAAVTALVAQSPGVGAITGAITGTVTAAPSAQPLAGARVGVSGGARAVMTDERGHYRIVGLQSGEYVVTASMVGREPGRRTVRVSEGTPTVADFALAQGSLLLSEIVVSASRAARPANEAAATVNVLTREQVRTNPARTVDDLVREMPGVELPRTSSTVSGPEQIVSIRGADEGRTLVLLDGVPLNDPWGEWIQWNRAPRQSIDHVEVVEGGGSSLYGNYAMGGVISLFSRPLERRSYGATASGGSRGAGEFSLYGSDVRGPLAYSMSGDYGTGGGYTLLRPDQRGPVDRASEVTRRTVNGRADYALSGANNVYASASYFDDDRSLGTTLTEPNARRLVSGVLGGNFGSVLGGTLQASAFGQVQRYDSHASRVNATRTAETPQVAQHIPSHDVGGSVQWSRPAGVFELLSIGGDFRSMVGRLDEDVYGGTGAFTGNRSAGGSQQVGGAFVSGVLAPSAPLRIEASARVDAWRTYDGGRVDATSGSPVATTFPSKNNTAFAPRLGIRYALLPSVTVRGSAYKAFRAPTLSEQYRTFFAGPNTFLGNPALAPEYLTGYDAGIDWQPVPALELRATAFWNEYTDLASFTFKSPGATPGSAILQRQNVGRARSKGIEGELALRLHRDLTLTGNYNYNDARVTSGTTAGAFVNRVPLQRGTARLTYNSVPVGMLSAIYRYEGVSHTLSGVRLAPFAVVDLDARRTVLRGTELFVSVENLLDRQFTVNFSGPLELLGLPRTIRGGVSVSSF